MYLCNKIITYCMKPFYQKFKQEFTDRKKIAYKYFSIFSIINNLNLTKLEIDLLAYIAINGHIGSVSAKKEFMSIYDTTDHTLNNTISKLYKKHLLVKIDGKIRIQPRIKVDEFNNLDQNKFIFIYTCCFQNELKTE